MHTLTTANISVQHYAESKIGQSKRLASNVRHLQQQHEWETRRWERCVKEMKYLVEHAGTTTAANPTLVTDLRRIYRKEHASNHS